MRSTYNSFTNIEKVDNGLIFLNNTTKMNKAKVVVYVYSSHFDRYIIYICYLFCMIFPTPLNISFHLEVTKIYQLTLVLLHWFSSLVPPMKRTSAIIPMSTCDVRGAQKLGDLRPHSFLSSDNALETAGVCHNMQLSKRGPKTLYHLLLLHRWCFRLNPCILYMGSNESTI